MALTTAQQVRLKIQDPPTLADNTYYGDGQSLSFTLPHRNIVSGSAYVFNASGQWSATGATFNTSGSVSFSDIMSAGSGFRTTYVFSNFSDAEVEHFITAGGNVNGAAVQAIEALMFDSLRRARWMAPDGAQYDDTQAQAMLSRMYTQFKEEGAEEAIYGGGFQSWSLNQQDYP